MSQDVTTVVNKLWFEQKPKSDGTGMMDLVKISIPDVDVPVSGFASQAEGIHEGDSVRVLFKPGKTKKGDIFNSLVSIRKVESPVIHDKATPEALDVQTKARTIGKTMIRTDSSKLVQSAVPNTTKVEKTTRDLSQEISGFMQSLVNSGKYHTEKVNPEYGSTSIFLNDTLLEIHVNRLLDLKNKLMSERS